MHAGDDMGEHSVRRCRADGGIQESCGYLQGSAIATTLRGDTRMTSCRSLS